MFRYTGVATMLRIALTPAYNKDSPLRGATYANFVHVQKVNLNSRVSKKIDQQINAGLFFLLYIV